MGFLTNYLRNLMALAVGRQPQRPLLFSYYVTHRCQLNCRYCSDGAGRPFHEEPVPELNTADACRLITILARAAATLDLTGGEPLLREDLADLLRHARQCGLRTVLNTKGIGLPARPELLALTDTLVLSIDTLNPARLAALLDRPVAVAEQVLQALEFAVRRRREHGTRVVLSAVATPDNLAEVADVLAFTRRKKLGFHLSPELVGTRVHPRLRDNPDYRQLVEQVRRDKQARPGVLGLDAYLCGIRDFSTFTCHPLLMPVIRPDGHLYYPCLEHKQAAVDVLAAGDYPKALTEAQRQYGALPPCADGCQIFCHMALSLLQRHPLAALGEGRHWNAGG